MLKIKLLICLPVVLAASSLSYTAYGQTNNNDAVQPTEPNYHALLKRVPAVIDTSKIYRDLNGKPYRFYQYFRLLLDQQAAFFISKVSGKYLMVAPKNDSYDRPPLLNPGNLQQRLASAYALLSAADSIVVQKSKRRLMFYRNDKVFLSYHCDLGQVPVGDKEKAGDRKTPEGHYRLTGKTTQVKYYKAYLISYPDSAHIKRAQKLGAQPGDQIMVHGTSDSRKNKKDWTNGCIAIANAGMDSLFKYVIPGTPISIYK